VVYCRLLDDARTLSARAIQYLRTLRDRFPACLPVELIEQVERIRTDPAHERRRCPRLPAPDTPAAVAEPCDLASWSQARLIDRSPGGLAFRLGHPVEAGAILLVWLGEAPGEDAWVPVMVRHCRQAEEGWVVGGEFFGWTHYLAAGSDHVTQAHPEGQPGPGPG